MAKLAKWLSCVLEILILQSLKLQISRLLRARSSLPFRQLQSVDSLWNAYVTWQEHTVILTIIANFYNVSKLISQLLVIYEKMNFSSDKLTLKLFYLEWLSGYLILLCETSTLKGNNWGEKLQKLQIKRVFYHYRRATRGGGWRAGGHPCSILKIRKKCPDCGHLWVKFSIQNVVLEYLGKITTKFLLAGPFFLVFLTKCLQKCPNPTKPPLPWKKSGCAPALLKDLACRARARM